MSEAPKVSTENEAPKASKEKLTTKQERCLQLAKTRYALRLAGKWPYLLRGEQKYLFGKPDRQALRADLRHAWREKYPDEAPPADAALNPVIDDLRRLALDADPDPITEDEHAGPGQYGAAGDEDEGNGLDLITGLADCPLPEDYQIPEGYQVRPDGIWHLLGKWGPSRATWAWLFPVSVYIDPDGDQLVELVWRDHGRWVNRLIRRSISKSGRKLVNEAGDAGLPITDADAKDAERWLAAAEAANAAIIPRHPVARQLGWQSDCRTFVTSQDSPWRVEPKYPQQVPAMKAHRPCGTLAGWQKAIRHAKPYPIAQLGIYEGLAPALLHVLGVDSFTVDHGGKSSRGKTITVMAGLSCWADPSEKGDGLLSWQTTVIEAERRFNLVSGLPVVLDESRLVKDPATVDTILYEVPKNHGKPRGGGWPSMLPWRTIVLSTGEQPATSFTTHQGASARVLSVQQPPFGTGSERSRTAAEALKSGLETNYGTAGPAFVARLQAKLAERGGAEDLRRRHAALTKQLRGKTDMSGRRGPLVAVIVLAAKLAAAWGITPFELPQDSEWLNMLSATDDPRENRPEMALGIVAEYVAAHQDKMYGFGDGEYPPASGWIGKETKDRDIALMPEKVREELKRRGYELDAVLPGWLEMKALVTRDNQQPPHLINCKLGRESARHLALSFHRAVWADWRA